MLAPKIIYTVFVASLGYFLVLTIYYIFLAVVGSIEEMKKAMQEIGRAHV